MAYSANYSQEDQSTILSTMSDLSGISSIVDANSTYIIEAFLQIKRSSDACDVFMDFTGPVDSTSFGAFMTENWYYVEHAIGSTGFSGLSVAAKLNRPVGNNTVEYCHLNGLLITNESAGVLQMRYSVVGANTVTVLAHSWIKATKVE